MGKNLNMFKSIQEFLPRLDSIQMLNSQYMIDRDQQWRPWFYFIIELLNIDFESINIGFLIFIDEKVRLEQITKVKVSPQAQKVRTQVCESYIAWSQHNRLRP